MENKVRTEKLTRRQLYDEIWQISVAGVARKYDLVYTRLMAVCKSEAIPYPSSGYWTKKNMGKDVSGEVASLTGDENKVIPLSSLRSPVSRIPKTKQDIKKTEPKKETSVLSTEQETSVEPQCTEKQQIIIAPARNEAEEHEELLEQDYLLFLDADERKRVLFCAQRIKTDENARLHKVLVQYRKELSDYTAKLNEAKKNPYYNPRVHKPSNEPAFFTEMSEAGTKRAFAILDALFKAIEGLGGSINSDLSVKIREDIVRFRMAEGQDQVKHELTKQEAQQLVKYNDEVKHGHWASKPQIRKYDKVYNGKLRIIFGERKYIRDSSLEALEDHLGDILIALYEKSEENRIVREAREAEERKRREAERLREERRKRKEQEARQVIELANKAEDYRIANEIRVYIEAVIDSGKEERDSEWVQWARKKADWYDPTIAYNDELLGTREHEKDKEEKDKALKDSSNSSRRWYW